MNRWLNILPVVNEYAQKSITTFVYINKKIYIFFIILIYYCRKKTMHSKLALVLQELNLAQNAEVMSKFVFFIYIQFFFNLNVWIDQLVNKSKIFWKSIMEMILMIQMEKLITFLNLNILESKKAVDYSDQICGWFRW